MKSTRIGKRQRVGPLPDRGKVVLLGLMQPEMFCRSFGSLISEVIGSSAWPTTVPRMGIADRGVDGLRFYGALV